MAFTILSGDLPFQARLQVVSRHDGTRSLGDGGPYKRSTVHKYKSEHPFGDYAMYILPIRYIISN